MLHNQIQAIDALLSISRGLWVILNFRYLYKTNGKEPIFGYINEKLDYLSL